MVLLQAARSFDVRKSSDAGRDGIEGGADSLGSGSDSQSITRVVNGEDLAYR